MPHISKHNIDNKIQDQLGSYILKFLSQTNTKRQKKIFQEIITETERLMIAKRIGILFFVVQHTPTHKISNLLKVSPSTVARFETAVESHKYRATLEWIKKHLRQEDFTTFILELISIPFEVRKKSFGKFLDDLYE